MRRLTLFAAGLLLPALLTSHLLAKPAIPPGKLDPGPNDTNITKLTAWILQTSHFRKQPFNDQVSSDFLDQYLDALDNRRMYFTHSDIAEFEKYRTALDEMTLKDGDTTPARVIFKRFRERAEQRYDYATELLKTEKFRFDGNERFLLSRKNATRPKDLTEAKELWRQLLHYEYLEEKLSTGRPEVICKTIQETLEGKAPAPDAAPKDTPPNKAAKSEATKLELKQPKAAAVRAALDGKLGKEKADEVARLVDERLGKESTESIAAAIRAKLEQSNAEDIVKKISKRYDTFLRTLWEYEGDDVLQFYLTALARVYDPHSDYMGRAEFENFAIGMKLSLFGIGAQLTSEDGYCKIISLVPGSPAALSKKLKPSDKIVAVAQADDEPVDVVDMKLRHVVDLIRGPKDTKVRLTIIPADAPDPSVRQTVSLIRKQIRLEDQQAKASLIELPPSNGKTSRLGIIDLPSFYSAFEIEGRRGEASEQKSTTTDVARLIKELLKEKIDGLVLDLRRNGGGSLEEAINLTGLFIKEGPVVQVQDAEGHRAVDSDPDPGVVYDGPLVVLTSRHSASASEILAGALQDYGRALIVGDSSTHGKGTVQSLIQLGPIMARRRELLSTNNPGAVKITIRKFYRASGESTQERGVIPDIILPAVNNHAEVGEKYLDHALPWDTIEAASYDKLNRIEPLLPQLRERSETRRTKDADYEFIRQEIERYKKLTADKTVSLNEAQRLKEKDEADARAKARKKELAARPPSPGSVFVLTLKTVSEPEPTTQVIKTRKTRNGDRETAADTTDKDKDNDAAPKREAEFTSLNDPADEDEPRQEADSPELDIALEETKRILLDLIALSAGPDALVSSPPTAAK